jgi:ribose transport system ATP-binding protein
MSHPAGQTPALEVRGLVKDFGGQRALAGVDLEVRAGEIHALLGENGAGKSTLIKILAGVIRPDGGQVLVGGRVLPTSYPPAEATRLGLHFVHQDLGLIDSLTVAENVALEVGFATRHGLLSMRETERLAAGLLARQGVELSPRTLVGDLRQAEKVMVAIARAFSVKARAIVLDEVSASLPGPEVERLAQAVRAAASSGVAFIWVTHRLDELDGFADRVTVLRDGRRVASAPMRSAGHDRLVEWIVGRHVELKRTGRPLAADRPRTRLRVRDLCGLGLAEGVSFDVRHGEILGITGLIGSGAAEVARLLGGSPHVTGGTALLDGEPLPLGRPDRVREAGCNYVPGDRVRDGALPTLTVRENFLPARLRRAGDPFIRHPRRERRAAEQLVITYGVRPRAGAELRLEALSGGNQQKVLFGRSLRSAPRLLVLNDPTVGVDVGSRSELYALLERAITAGTAVVLASSDFDEIVALADRVLVMGNRRVRRELDKEDLSRERLAAESYARESRTGAFA